MSEQKQEMTTEQKKKKKRLLLLFLLLLIIGIVGGVYYYVSNKTEPVQVISGDYLPDTKNAKKMTDKELKKAEQKAVDASKFNMVIKPEAIFETGDSEGTIYIQNPTQNAYPINVTIQLDKTKEEVYSSGAIEPGFEIAGGKLSKKLSAGEYPATATFNIYDSKTKEKRGEVQAAIVIKVRS